MKRMVMSGGVLCLALISAPIWPAQAQGPAQNQGLKFVDNTLLVEAKGIYVADPDLATLTFDINSQDKELKKAYDNANQSMQRILAIAEQNGLSKNDVESGVLTLSPLYNGGNQRKTHGYLVQGQLTVKIRDFTKIGPILDASVQEGLVDSRSLTYSLENEEAAKDKAVAEAVRDAVGRARAALDQNGQKPGAIRYANVDVSQAVVQQVIQLEAYASRDETISVNGTPGATGAPPAAPPPLPPVRPQKITVTATVQCAFQIQ